MSRRKIRRLIGTTAALLGAAAALVFTAQWLQLAPLAGGGTQAQPEIALERTALTHYDESGEQVWRLRADHIGVDQDARSTRATGVTVTFFDPGSAGLLVSAASLAMDHNREDLRFEGGLQAQGPDGLRFATESARWLAEEEVLESAAPFRAEQGELLLEGTGFRYSAAEGRFLVQREAHLRWAPQSASEEMGAE